MKLEAQNSPLKRLSKVLTAIAAVLVVALAPAFIATTLLTNPLTEDPAGSQVNIVEYDEPDEVETVRVITGGHVSSDEKTGITGWSHLADADVIKITVVETGTDVKKFTAVETGIELGSADGDADDPNCSFTLTIEGDDSFSESDTFVGYIRVDDEQRNFADGDCTVTWVDEPSR